MADEAAAETAAPEGEEAGASAAPATDHGVPVSTSRGQRVLHPTREQLVDLVTTLRDEGWLMCLDVTAVDYLTAMTPRHLPEGIDPERFEVVVTLISHAERERVRLRVQVPADDPVVPTLFRVHPGTEALEREVFDMFGIRFDGHPDLTRILMPEEWMGHPLRKDDDVGRIPVQFKAATNVR